MRVQAGILGAGIEDLFAGLDHIVGRADQKIGEVRSRLTAAEVEGAVFTIEIAIVDLVIVKLAAELKAVPADDLGEIVLDLKGVVELARGVRGHADGEVDEIDVGHALKARRDGADAARRTESPWEAERFERRTHAPLRSEQVVGGAEVAEADFIDSRRAEGFRIAEYEDLAARVANAVETGDSRAAVGIRRVQV